MGTSRLRRGPYLAVLGLVLATATGGRAAPGSPGAEPLDPLAIEGPPYSVWVGNQTECCPKIVELRVKKEGWEEERALEMTGRTQTLQKLQPVIEPRLLVVGTLRYGGTNLWIANLETLEQEAEIWNYGYGLSPSGRFLVYQTHYPPHGLPGGRRSIFLLYDLSLPPEENRPGPLSDWPEPNLGTPIFPKENVERRSWSILESQRSYGLTSPFLWSQDEATITFLTGGSLEDMNDRRGYIVRVDLSPDGQVREVRQEQLSLENLDLPYRTRSLEHIERNRPMFVNLDSIAWAKDHGDGRWVVGTTPSGDELGSKVWIRVP